MMELANGHPPNHKSVLKVRRTALRLVSLSLALSLSLSVHSALHCAVFVLFVRAGHVHCGHARLPAALRAVLLLEPCIPGIHRTLPQHRTRQTADGQGTFAGSLSFSGTSSEFTYSLLRARSSTNSYNEPIRRKVWRRFFAASLSCRQSFPSSIFPLFCNFSLLECRNRITRLQVCGAFERKKVGEIGFDHGASLALASMSQICSKLGRCCGE